LECLLVPSEHDPSFQYSIIEVAAKHNGSRERGLRLWQSYDSQRSLLPT